MFGCKPQPAKVVVELLNERYHRILNPDSIEQVHLNFQMSEDQQIRFLESALGYSLCYNDAEFVIPLIDSSQLRCYVEYECDSLVFPHCFPVMWDYEILVNKHGQCLVNRRLVNLDSVTSILAYEYPDSSVITDEGVALHWDREVDPDSLGKLFVCIKDGFLLNAERVSQKRFNEPIKSLTDAQFDSLILDTDYYLNLYVQKPWIEEPPAPEKDFK